jgi:GDP-4-dehydro-6-deoxy-D-mannose reductase
MEQGEAADLYCICSGRDIAIQELADTLVGMATTPMTLVTDPDRYRPVDIPVLRGSNAKIHAATGWSPSFSIADTLGDLLDECRARARSDVATHGNPKSTPRSSS